jgi:hypothetical protein
LEFAATLETQDLSIAGVSLRSLLVTGGFYSPVQYEMVVGEQEVGLGE